MTWPTFFAFLLSLTLASYGMAASRWEITTAGAVSTPVILAHTPDRKIVFVSGTYARGLSSSPALQIEYTCELIPFLMVFEPHEEGLYFFKHSGALRQVNQGPAAIYVAGAAPLGFRFTLRPQWKVSPYFSTSGGFVLSAKPIPYQVEEGTQFNFMFHFGAGLRMHLTPQSDLRFGYRWLHISNAYRTVINPGIDANIFELGLSFQ